MVDFDVVKERLIKGAYVGAGSFASSFAEGMIEEQLGTGELGSALAEVGVGLGVSVGVDEVFSNRSSMPNEAVEYLGYGIQGAGFASLADSVQTGAQTGRVVSVSANAGAQNEQATRQAATADEFSMDTA